MRRQGRASGAALLLFSIALTAITRDDILLPFPRGWRSPDERPFPIREEALGDRSGAMKRWTARSGFTLIEIMIVVALLLLLSVIVTPTCSARTKTPSAACASITVA
jgi:prepilin-type N-terminal cleavage/methylation domain-containing protein